MSAARQLQRFAKIRFVFGYILLCLNFCSKYAFGDSCSNSLLLTIEVRMRLEMGETPQDLEGKEN